jgi:hypothetical protein
MQIRKNRMSLYRLVAIMVICTMSACYFEESRSPIPVQNDHFFIDTESVLTSIAEGKVDVFVPIESSSDLGPSPASQPVNWTQADYLEIANALHKFVWGEPLDTWVLNSMSFRVSCSAAQNGLQYAHFVFFAVRDFDDNDARIEHNLIIDAESSSVDVWATKYQPVVMRWNTIDLRELNYTAEQVLQIAEGNGGEAKREAVNNTCYISVSLVPDSAGFDGWRVKYYENPGILFELHVDPITGKQK